MESRGRSSNHPKPSFGFAGRGRQRRGLSEAVLKKAAAIGKRSGLVQKDAIRVALGKATVQQVLKEMMVAEKVERLVRKHDLERSTACNVVQGSLDLDTALLLKGMRECETWVPNKSVLTDLDRNGAVGVFYLYDRPPLCARVNRVEKYDCWFEPEGEKPFKLEKHNILMACLEEEAEKVDQVLGSDVEVKSLGLGPSTNYKDRFRSRKRELFRHYRDTLPTRVVLRDGSVLEGTVAWFGKWEFGLKLASGATPVIFRHAMQQLEVAGKKGSK